MKKRLFISLLTVCLLSLFCLTAFAAQPDTVSENAFRLSAVSVSNMETDALNMGVGDKTRLRIYASGENLRNSTFTLHYDTDAFTYTASSTETYDGKITTLVENGGNGMLSFTCAPAENASFSGSVLLATVYFDTTADVSQTAYQFTLHDDTDVLCPAVTVSITHRHAFGAWETVSVSEDGKTQKQKRDCIQCDVSETREVAVVNYSISLKADAQKIKYNADEKLLYAIAPATTVGTLLDSLTSEGNMQVISTSGKGMSRDDVLATGMMVLVMDEGDIDATVQFSAEISVWGDINGDGKVGTDDARQALRHSVGLEKEPTNAQFAAADTDENGKIDTADARFLLRVSVGLDAFYAIKVSNISLSKTHLDLQVGQSSTINAVILPSDATVKTLSWRSSDTNVATVQNGKVTAKGAGTAVITATASSGVKATCTVTVEQPVLSVTYKRVNFYLPENGSVDLTSAYTVNPSNANTNGAAWETSNSAFTVTDGVVRCTKAYSALTDKTATVTLTFKNGKSAVFKVTLIPSTASYCHFNYETLQVSSGQQFKLSGSISAGYTLNLVSSDTNILSVDSSTNVITAKNAGVATLTCTGVDYSATVTVHVMSSSFRLVSFNVNKDGNDLVLSVKNTSDQTLQRIIVNVTGYNASGTEVATKACGISNVPADNSTHTYTWKSNLWNDADVATAKITKIVLTFADGTTQTVPAGCWYVGE